MTRSCMHSVLLLYVNTVEPVYYVWIPGTNQMHPEFLIIKGVHIFQVS